MTDKPIVLLEQAKKSFGDAIVLKDISLSVSKGEVVGIIGPSGGGKSTLLRCMTLLETLDSGRLAYGDLIVAENDAAGRAAYASKAVQREAKMRFGLVFQNFNLFPHYTVLKNITDAPLHVQKRPKDEVFEHARALLGKMGLAGTEDKVPCELSGGMQQRVAIARALVNNPATIIADEPTGNLDPERSMEIMTLLVKINQLGTTVVVVTHEKDLVNKFGKRVITIDQGRIINDSVGGYVGGHIHE